MFRIEDIMNENFDVYPKEVQDFMRKFNGKIRQYIQDGLVNDMAEKMLSGVERSNETFMNILTEILENGCKGFKDMSTHKLINMYLDRKSEKDFIMLIEKINNEIE